MTARNVLHLYRVRLRARLVQECFAVVGIAAGVALLFASQVASQSLSSSVAQLSHGIVGNATLQLLARDPHGFAEGCSAQVRAIPGVRVAAPLLEASANAIGPKGSDSVELVGADSSLAELGGALVRHTAAEPVRRHRRGRAAGAAGAQARRDEVRRGSDVPADGRRRAGAAVRAAARKADRAADRQPDRGRAAVLRPGNERACARPRHPHPRRARARPRSRGARGARARSPPGG